MCHERTHALQQNRAPPITSSASASGLDFEAEP